MLYSRVIESIIDESVAALLGGYSFVDFLSFRSEGEDRIRKVLSEAASDPRFTSTVRATREWKNGTKTLLEEFAQEMLDSPDASEEEISRLKEDFLLRYFFRMVKGMDEPVKKDGKGRGGKGSGKGSGGNGEGEDGDGEGNGDLPPDEKELEKAANLSSAFKEMMSGGENPNPEGRVHYTSPPNNPRLSPEEERRVETKFLRSIPTSLKKLAKMIGRSGGEESSSKGKFLSASKSDIEGISVGDDLGSVLPSELALLSCPETSDVFLSKFASKRLQIFASASSGAGDPTERQDGPVIICLDRSSSMSGRRTEIAKAITMAVTIIAKRRNRKVAVVLYDDHSVETFQVKSLRRDRLPFMRFLSYGCRGGNDEDSMFGKVFTEIVPGNESFSSADVLCVSDFGWAPVGEEVMSLIAANKSKGMKFYGLDITGEGISMGDMRAWGASAIGGFPPDIIDSMWVWLEERAECRESRTMSNVKR